MHNLTCTVCEGSCSLLDVVDFNKACTESSGRFLSLSGTPVYYAICAQCGFCFAPEFATWSPETFSARIYNDAYVEVDPDYVEKRPTENASSLVSMFGDRGRSIAHLDYGSGSGMLSDLLNRSGWQSVSYDPFDKQSPHIDQLGQFDLITAFEVFEHVADPQQLMRNLISLLAPTGIVLCSTLLSDGQLAPNRRINWWYASPRNGHISLFSKKSLTILTQSYGLNFGSFSDGFHVFFDTVPSWAAHLIRVA